jgi:predicted acyltransferase
VRHASLDGIRGLAILMMVFSGVIPYKVLPAWMYHAQLPPPTNAFNPAVAGITWVDLVFPMFLFAMGAAIPIALSRRIVEPAGTAFKIHGLLLKRGLLLAAFAIFLQHVRPYTMNSSPDAATWILALSGFVALWLVYAKANKLIWMGLGAVLGSLILFIGLPEYALITFSLNRSDIILLVLANMAFYGGVAWYWTRTSIPARLTVMAAVTGFMLIHPSGSGSPLPWLTNFYFLKYLLIVLPGTILGDWLVKTEGKSEVSGSLALGGLLLTVVTVIGLHQRWVLETTVVVALVTILLVVLNREQRHPMLIWAVLWLGLGFALEPFQGGIHKDPSTFSYYFVTSGLTLFLWFGWVWMERNHMVARLRGVVEDGGRNPMVAYVAFMNLLLPILSLTGMAGWVASLTASPWMGVLRGATYTAIVALITAKTSRVGWYWKT